MTAPVTGWQSRRHAHQAGESWRKFTGPDCGFDTGSGPCAREVDHIGDHHTDPATPPADPWVRRLSMAAFWLTCINVGALAAWVVR